MAGESRSAFLARVRAALGRTETALPSDPPAVNEALVRLASSDDDLVALFESRAGEVGMHVRRTTEAGAADVLLEILEAHGAQSVAFSGGCEGAAAVRESGRRVVEGSTAELYDVDAGVTAVDAALAETGTLVLHAAAGHARGLSLLPPTHVALLRASDIVPDMLDYWAQPRPETSSRVFVTGPSKTADIEGELIEGVHGPGSVYVVLIEDR